MQMAPWWPPWKAVSLCGAAGAASVEPEVPRRLPGRQALGQQLGEIQQSQWSYEAGMGGTDLFSSILLFLLISPL